MMKRILIVLMVIPFLGCEDVVDIDPPTEAPRLIVDALIRVDSGQPNTVIRVKVSETQSFFEDLVPADLEQITLFNSETNELAVLNEWVEGTGEYVDTVATAMLTSGNLQLTINHKDNLYLAFSDYTPTVPFDTLEFGDDFLFDTDDIELILGYTDVAEREDYYLFDFDFGNYFASEDTFYDGQAFEFSYFYDTPIADGETVSVSIMGIDRDFYNYMNQLLEQSGDNAFGPFQTPAVTVRGNIINTTEIDNIDNFNNLEQTNNYALGYFAVVEEYRQDIVYQE